MLNCKTVANSKADDYFAAKQNIPTELRTSEMSFLSQQIRERSFWSANVDSARILTDIHKVISKIISGDLSNTEARVEMLDFLDANGYKPTTGTSGSIKDLRLTSRQEVMIKTNTEMARGYAQYAEAQTMIDMFPCQELVRARRAEVPRNWHERWLNAGGKIYRSGRLIAQVNDPIWVKISRFDNPYPPFDFNSGMVIEPIERDEAIELGVIKEDSQILEAQNMPSINENLEAKISAPEKLWSDILKQFGGFAQKSGDKLIFTDANGTKPYSAEKLADVIFADNLPNIYGKGKSPNIQRDALISFTNDPYDMKAAKWSDKSQDFLRLVRRTEDMKNCDKVFRGLAWNNVSNERRLNFLKEIENGEITSNLFDSYSLSEESAKGFALRNATGAIIEVRKPKNVKSIIPSVEKYNPSYTEEKEVLFPDAKKFKVVKKETSVIGGTEVLKIIVEEV